MSISLAEDIEKLRCLQKLHFKHIHISCLLLAYALAAFCGNIFPYIPVGFFSVYSTTQKDIYFDGSVSSPLPRASSQATPASYGEKSRAKMMHKYFDLFTVACWDHSARLVLKTILKNLQVQQSLCLLICLHTDTVSPLWRAFPSGWTLYNCTPVVPFLLVAELYKL